MPFFAAGPSNSNVKLDLYGRIVGQRKKGVAIRSAIKGKDYFALLFKWIKGEMCAGVDC